MLVAVIALVIMGIFAVAKRSSEWDETYIGAANALRHGKDIYKDLSTYTYPPFSAWVMTPFTFLPIRVARGIWFCVLSLCLVYFIRTAWRLSGGPPVQLLAPPGPQGPGEQIAFLLGHVCALQLTLNALTHCQTDVPIAALLITGCVCIAESRFLRAAVWIGIAAAFKATPLLFAPYLIWRRQWAAALILVLVAVGANLLPDTIHRPAAGGTWLTRWYQIYLAPMAKPTYVPGAWKNMLNNNQALTGAASRWVLTSWREDSEDLRTVDRPGWSPQWLLDRERAAHPEMDAVQVSKEAAKKVVRAVYLGLTVAVAAPAVLVLLLRRRRPAPGADIASSGLPRQVVIECGMVMMLMLLLSPNSSRAHFCIMYLPAFCIARIAVRPGASKTLRILLALALLSSTLSIHVRLGTRTFEQILLWLGVVMFASIFLLLACAWALWAGPQPASASSLDDGRKSSC